MSAGEQLDRILADEAGNWRAYSGGASKAVQIDADGPEPVFVAVGTVAELRALVEKLERAA